MSGPQFIGYATRDIALAEVRNYGGFGVYVTPAFRPADLETTYIAVAWIDGFVLQLTQERNGTWSWLAMDLRRPTDRA